MKHFYALFFLFLTSTAFAQQTGGNGEIEGFRLYPNPVTQGKVQIVTDSPAPKEIRIFDVLGTPVLHTTIQGTELNLSRLQAGVYLIQVYQRDKVATRKLIVK